MATGPGPKDPHRPLVLVCAALLGAALLAGCSNTVQVVPVAPAPAPAQPSLQEWMQQAQAASHEGQRERARQAWRSAAKAYPTQKSPWQRLAEDYFDTADYGNAILAAQEVLQRDEQDTLAHSVLAVSGLRLSTVSLVALRERTNYAVGSREEAMGLTRAMRDALGETALVPQRAAEAAPPPTRSTASAAPAARNAAAALARPPQNAAVASRAPVGPAPSVVPVAAPAPAVSAQARPAADPFKLLK